MIVIGESSCIGCHWVPPLFFSLGEGGRLSIIGERERERGYDGGRELYE